MPPVWELLCKALRGVTVEPMVMLYFLTHAISAFAGGNLILQKACHPDRSSEPDYSEPCPDEAAAQKVVTEINTWKPTLESFIPLLFVIFLGAWSDTHGKRRKPLLFIPLIGELIRLIAMMCSVRYWKLSPEVTAAIEAFLKGLSGNVVCFSFGANTYISDITTKEDRTLRLGVISALAFVGSPIGVMLGGILRMKLGFFNLFALCLVINVISLILGVLLMKDTACVETKLKTFEGVCDPSHFIRSVKTVFKKRPENKRLIVFLMGCVAPIFIACFVGEFAVMYFFLRYKFQMDEVEFGNYCAFKMLVIFVGTFVSLIICSKMLKMSDALIGCIGTVTQIAAAVGLCFSEFKWQLYFFPVLDLMHGASGTAAKSIISKCVESSELGQVFGVIGALDVIVPLAVFPFYNLIYRATFQTMPGAFYFLSVFLAFIILLMFFQVYVIERKTTKLSEVKLTEKLKKGNCSDLPLT